VGSQPKGQWASHLRRGRLTFDEDANRIFIGFDQADSDKDDLLSYLEIETCWRSSSW
jgi:hypothetical protein